MMRTLTTVLWITLLLFYSCGIDDYIPNDDDAPSPTPEKYILSTLTTLPIGTGGLDVDVYGNIYAADFGVGLANINGSDIFKINPRNGESELFANLEPTGLTGNHFDALGNLYQSNFLSSKVFKIDQSGNAQLFTQEVALPTGITIDKYGNIYILSCQNGTITKFTQSGNSSILATSADFKCANGITWVKDTGNIYVVNFNDGNVLEVTPTGEISILTPIPNSTGNAHITSFDGELYLTAASLGQIYKVSLDGTSVEVIAGDGSATNTDGDAKTSGLRTPNDLAFSPDGKKIYINCVANSGNSNELSPTVIRVLEKEH
ncbi:NHL repeat-containing protein [Aquimarina mytili]|uniref:SMP-30/Gluconolactonase/LRE-like region domain-containing protein n=1 Tax=Aquimarina mytili TaxID=874423 RepID=A0A936ZSL7_9FLAO|nr:hypothetical protein [Aquimarina mytili]MBL0683542.1 hypothetical protein [Aquimarina mytili]